MTTKPPPIERYALFLEALTPDRIGELTEHCAPTVRFRDPFNDVSGIDAYAQVLDDMFDNLAEVGFKVHHTSCDRRICYMSWRFEFRGRPGAPQRTIDGVSKVRFDKAGLVIEHADYWDAASQVYEGLPVIGAVLRAIRRRLAA